MPAKTLDQVEQTLSIKEFMARVGVKSEVTIYNWIRKRYIKTVKIGKRRFIPVSELDRLVKAGKYGM
jgi:excisionase family DNA binding protein